MKGPPEDVKEKSNTGPTANIRTAPGLSRSYEGAARDLNPFEELSLRPHSSILVLLEGGRSSKVEIYP